MILYHFAEEQVRPARITALTPRGYSVEVFFAWPLLNDGATAIWASLDAVAATALIEQAPYLWLTVLSLSRNYHITSRN